jgi:TPR repeat protein
MRALSAVLLPVALIFGPVLAQAQGASEDAAPQLVSTGPKWKNVPELRRFAEGGDPQACFELGDRLLNGDGVAVNEAEARRFLEKAAQADLPDALFRLGKLNHDGIGGPRDFAKALDYYGRAARAGIPEAQHNIGAMLVSGRGVKRDYVEGLAWLIVATKSGAVSDAEQRTRERLAKRPADIAAAEKRAAELLAAFENPQSAAAKPRATFGTATAPPPPSRVTPPAVEAPKKVNVDLGPKLTAPKPELDIPKS